MPKRGASRSISLPTSPFFYEMSTSASAATQEQQPPRRQLSSALSSHLDRCMSAHSYHAEAFSRRRRSQTPRSQSSFSSVWTIQSVVAEALRLRARRLSFVDDGGNTAGPLASPEEEAPPSSPLPTIPSLERQEPRGTVLDGAAILFTAIASFPVLSLPWSASTLGWTGVFAIGACGVATAYYSCWLMTYLVGVSRMPSNRGDEAEKNASNEGTEGCSEEFENTDFRHGRYHDVAATILSKKIAARFVDPIQAAVCGGICVVTMLIGGTTLKALSRLLSPSWSSSSPSSSPLRLPIWIAIYGVFQATSLFVPTLASSTTVALAGSIAFLVFWGIATVLSAVAGVEQHKLSTPESPFPPPGFHDLAATSLHERAFAALNGLGVALFAWSNAFAPEVQATLKRPHDVTMRKSTLAAFWVLIPTYLLIAVFGFWAFGKNTNAVVLLNLEPASLGGEVAANSYKAPRAALAIAWFSVLINLYALFAVYAFPIYELLDAAVAARVERWRKRREEKNNPKTTEEKAVAKAEKAAKASEAEAGGNTSSSSNVLAVAIAARLTGRLVFCAGCTLVAAALPFFGDISAVLGVLTLALDFILPCLMFLRVRRSKMSRAAAVGLLGTAAFYVLLGVAIMVAALRSLFMNAHMYKLFADV